MSAASLKARFAGREVDIALRHQHVAGEAAINAGADGAALRAEVRLAGAAEAARAAQVEVGFGRDAVTRSHPGDTLADGCHVARKFVSQGDRRLSRVLIVKDVQIGAADTGSAHSHEDLTGTWLGLLDLAQANVALATRELGD